MEALDKLPVPTHDERTTAMLAPLLMIFTTFIGPLVLYLVKRESRFVAFHSLQALIFQAVYTVFSVFLMFGWFIFIAIMMAGQSAEHNSKAPVGIFILMGFFWLAWFVVWAINFILGIIYTIKAANGEWAGFPLIGRWVRRVVMGASTSVQQE